MKTLFRLLTITTLMVSTQFSFAQWSNTGNNQTTGNLLVDGSVNAGEFSMMSNWSTNFSIQKPQANGEPFRILLGSANVDGGIMLGRTDWLSKILIPWKVGIGNTTPQKNLDVNVGPNNYVSFGNYLDPGQWSGIHFGYKEDNNTSYRKSAIVFERVDDAANGKIHILNNSNGSQSASLSDSRLTIDQNGNTGIGITTPSGKLHVNGSTYVGNENGSSPFRISLGSSGGNYGSIGYGYKYTGTSNQHLYAVADYASQLEFASGGFTFKTAPQGSGGATVSFVNSVRITQAGQLGIGTETPYGPFQVNAVRPVIVKSNGGNGVYGSEIGFNAVLDTSLPQNKFKKLGSTSQNGGASIAVDYSGNMLFQMHDAGNESESIVNFNPQIVFKNNGNVGIGTTSPDTKLSVKGVIHTQEVRVDLNGAVAPDYVFEPTYNLLPLSEVESYIKANKHLPEVPSAKQMEEEGLNLKEMNLLLLKKVEELTLHLIEQQKVIERQNVRIEKLETSNK
jgi:hypothetical protein